MTQHPTFCWFSFRRDASHLLYSVASIRRLYPESQKFVFDDGSYPLPKRAKRVLTSWGVNVITTTFPRKGNLRGWTCAYKIAECYTWLANITGSEIVVKVDSDTIWLKKGWLEKFAESGCVLGGMRSKCRRGVCGVSYALKREGIDLLMESYKNELESPYSTEEDFEVCNRISKAKGGNGDDIIYKAPYSLWGIHPECPDAVGVAVDWGQNCAQFIADTMEVVVFAYDPPNPPGCKTDEKGQPVTTKAGTPLWLRARLLRASSMRSILKRVIQNQDKRWQTND